MTTVHRAPPPPRIRARVRAVLDQFYLDHGLEPPEREPLDVDLDDRMPDYAGEYERRYP